MPLYMSCEDITDVIEGSKYNKDVSEIDELVIVNDELSILYNKTKRLETPTALGDFKSRLKILAENLEDKNKAITNGVAFYNVKYDVHKHFKFDSDVKIILTGRSKDFKHGFSIVKIRELKSDKHFILIALYSGTLTSSRVGSCIMRIGEMLMQKYIIKNPVNK